MSCRDIRSGLYEYIDDTLDPSQRQMIEAHLQSCRDCRRELSRMQAGISAVRDLETVEPPPYLSARIMAGVRTASEKQSWFTMLFLKPVTLPAGALAVAAVAMISFSMYAVWHPFAVPGPQSHAPLVSTDTASRPPADVTSPGPSRSGEPLERLASHTIPDHNPAGSPGVEVLARVAHIDTAAPVLLRKLLDMDARILGIVSDGDAYRITAGIAPNKGEDLIEYMEQTFPNLSKTESLNPEENTLIRIVLQNRSGHP